MTAAGGEPDKDEFKSVQERPRGGELRVAVISERIRAFPCRERCEHGKDERA